MIRSLNIHRLRGFEHFEINDLGRINLFVGMNNSGKTTLLEAIQIISSPGDPYSLLRILSRRGEDWWDAGDRGRAVRYLDIRRLFFGHDISKGCGFSIRGFGDASHSLFEASIIDSPTPPTPPQPTLFPLEGVQEEFDEMMTPSALRLSWNRKPESDFAMPINRRGGLQFDGTRRSLSATSLEGDSNTRLISSSSLTPESVVELFEAIVLTPDEDLVIKALQIIDPSIERIATSSTDRFRYGSETTRGGILVKCSHTKNRIPIGSMGDGIWRMLGIALALVRAGGGILLIDEIDTGLHYSVMTDLWRLIYQTAERLNVQVFATTHSRDCFESLAAICAERLPSKNDITIQRVEQGNENAVGYRVSEIIAAAYRGMEVR